MCIKELIISLMQIILAQGFHFKGLIFSMDNEITIKGQKVKFKSNDLFSKKAKIHLMCYYFLKYLLDGSTFEPSFQPDGVISTK